MPQPHRVVIIGGGFGGLFCARQFRGNDASVTLIDRRNFHLFQPLLYQVATGALSPGNIAAALRAILRRNKSVEVLLGAARDLDPLARTVTMTDGQVSYDTLIVATGSTHQYFGHNEWEQHAPGLKTVEDATEIRRKILFAFEAAERATDPAEVAAWLTFVVVGGGPTGVELAGAIAEIAFRTMLHDFRHIDPSKARIVLVEGNERLLTSYPPSLSAKALQSLRRLGVEIRLDTRVTAVAGDHVVCSTPEGSQRIDTRTCLWGAGVKATQFGYTLAQRTCAPADSLGRLIVGPDLSLQGFPEILVIGDLASYSHQTGQPLPGVAQVAMQQGKYAARLIAARLAGRSLAPFHYVHYGSMATIGRASAVADLGPVRLWGWVGWMAWLFIHVVQIVLFQNRLLIMVQWAWSYFTFSRSARLITGEDLAPPVGES